MRARHHGRHLRRVPRENLGLPGDTQASDAVRAGLSPDSAAGDSGGHQQSRDPAVRGGGCGGILFLRDPQCPCLHGGARSHDQEARRRKSGSPRAGVPGRVPHPVLGHRCRRAPVVDTGRVAARKGRPGKDSRYAAVLVRSRHSRPRAGPLHPCWLARLPASRARSPNIPRPTKNRWRSCGRLAQIGARARSCPRPKNRATRSRRRIGPMASARAATRAIAHAQRRVARAGDSVA